MRRTIVLVGVLLVASAARAALVVALSVDELLARSTVVCVVRVTETRAKWRDDRIITVVRGRCERAVRGASAGQSLEWFVEGGMVGDVGMRVPGEPSFVAGDRALVFLSPAAESLRVTGMSQGVAWVEGERGAERLTPPHDGATLVRPVSGRLDPAAGWLARPRPLADVLADLDARANR